jgi:hypothetical protein
MTKKILFIAILFAFLGANFASAQVVAPNDGSFPSGCATGLGYSATTGLPCNGESTATPRNLPGCTTPLGYSATTGEPCSGGDIAISWLAGCTSTAGFSSITGEACNGTVAASSGGGGSTPGLPQTGAGEYAALTIASLLGLAGITAWGVKYLRKEYLQVK